MLIILLLFALVRTLQGVPLSNSSADAADSFSDLNLRDTQSHFGQRTVNDIIISCFATIFACTWTAIHPNIPALTDCWWTRFKDQVATMGCALLAPEFIVVWAIRQRLGAKYIMDRYNKEILGLEAPETKHPILNQIRLIPHAIRALFCHDSSIPTSSENGPQWTLTHGFFLQMGGFMLSDRGKPLYTLFLCETDHNLFPIRANEQLMYNIKNSIIDPPRITEADIQDRSKGDAISKTFIILQTSWFVVQCIARWAQHLPVTELEVATLAFAMLNVIIYALWWNKPQNVGRPVFLERKTQESISDDTVEHPNNDVPENSKSSDEEPIPNARDTESEPMLLPKIPRMPKWIRKNTALMRSLNRTKNPIIRTNHRVPMFYAADTDAGDIDTQFMTTFPIIGVIFGSVHLIPSWFLDFSLRQEMWLWRISAVIITAVPVIMAVFVCLGRVFDGFIVIIFVTLASIGICLYPFARIILLILSLTSLRSLPPAALQTIEWTTFIPHL